MRKYYCIREALPLGDMGDWLGLSFTSEDSRDQVYDAWWNTYRRQGGGKPVKMESAHPIGYLVSDVAYWIKRLS